LATISDHLVGIHKDICPKSLEIDEYISHFLTSEIGYMEFLVGGEKMAGFGGFGGFHHHFGLRRLLIFILVIAVIFFFFGSGFGF
jgi:hypothetical protein